jgi:hypothetical protein
MNCAYHVDVESVGFCVNCGRALCDTCKRDVEGSVYCQACLSDFIRARSAGPQESESPGSGGDNPGAAFALGLIPGVGAIYNGEFLKAVIHLVVFGFLIGLSDMSGRSSFEALFVLLIVGFYFYMPFEAYYTAKKRKLRNEGIELETPIDRFNEQLDRVENKELWLGVGLVVFGSLALLDNFGRLPLQEVLAFWPVVLIAAGVYLVMSYRGAGKRESEDEL